MSDEGPVTVYAESLSRTDRVEFSRVRLQDLESRVSEQCAGLDLGPLFAFAAGSYARLEAGMYSDIDLFFGYADVPNHALPFRRTNELRLFGRVIDAVDNLGFPALSGDSRYLKTHLMSEVLDEMGGDRDDVENHFTFRMLMLLESQCVLGHTHYVEAVRRTVEAYYVDYPKHKGKFQPWYLLNDITKYWKTLTLNYEHKRRKDKLNDPEENERRARNFKLKYSRMTTCFSTVVAIGALMREIGPHDIADLVLMTPRDRLLKAKERVQELDEPFRRLDEEYAWFLELTGQSTERLFTHFENSGKRTEMFARAEEYGSLMYQCLRAIDEDLRRDHIEFLRLLVI